MPISTLEFKSRVIGKIKEKIEIKEKMGPHLNYQLWFKGYKILTTFCSHGSGGRDISDNILSKIKRQLKLDNLNQLYNLRDCPMSAEDYLSLLKQKNVISD